MREHSFTLVLTIDPNDQQSDELYAVLDDGTIATSAGSPPILFHRTGVSLEEAIRSAIADVRSVGIDVERVEMSPGAVAAAP